MQNEDLLCFICSLEDLSNHIDSALERIAQLKIVDNVSLGSSATVGELHREWQTNEIRLNHMRMVADALFYLSEEIKVWNVPQFELLTSLQVLTKGTHSYVGLVSIWGYVRECKLFANNT